MRFIPARYYTSGALAPPRAILWHMAEGGGTVQHLKHPPTDNSAHYVIQSDGEIVQMVALTDAAHSAHVAIDPDDQDADDCGIYSETVARSVLGLGYADINRYVIAVEVEGFRADGPNDRQIAAIVDLSASLRVRFASLAGNLGHRDVQDYKSCPGCKFPWSQIGGHGLYQEDDVTIPVASSGLFDVDLPVGVQLYDTGFAPLVKVTVAQTARGLFATGAGGFMAVVVTSGGDRQLLFVKRAAVTVTEIIDGSAGALAAALARIEAARAALED